MKFDGRLSVKQDMPMKPDKVGIKVWLLADADMFCVPGFQVHLGKNHTNSDLFKLKGPGYYEPYLDNNQHFFFDNFFTSVDLMQHMQLRNTCACGTIHQNRKDLPADLERIDLVAGEVRTCQSGNLEVVEMPVLVLCHFVHGEHLVLSWKN